jgi:hypothetical protein
MNGRRDRSSRSNISERKQIMVINRLTIVAKQGKIEEVVAMLKEGVNDPNNPPIRILRPVVGSFNTVVWEGEFESVAAFDAFWAEWRTRPETSAFFERWNPLVESTGGSELLRIE